MQLNQTTGQYELTLQDSHLMRRLDKTVAEKGSAIVETDKGDVTILRRNNKFFALNLGMAMTATGFTASSAFLNLAAQLRGAK